MDLLNYIQDIKGSVRGDASGELPLTGINLVLFGWKIQTSAQIERAQSRH